MIKAHFIGARKVHIQFLDLRLLFSSMGRVLRAAGLKQEGGSAMEDGQGRDSSKLCRSTVA